MTQISFCLCLQHPGLFLLIVCSDTLVGNVMTTIFQLRADKMKVAHDEQIFLKVKCISYVILKDLSCYVKFGILCKLNFWR